MAVIEKQNRTGISYEVSIYLPIELQRQYNRKRIFKNFINKKEAEKWERIKNKEIASGYLTIYEDITFYKASEEYLEEMKSVWSISSINTYISHVRIYHLPIFQNKTLDKISIYDIKAFNRMVDNLNITEKTKHNISTGLRSFFKWCIEKGYIEEFSLGQISSYSQKPTKTRDFLTMGELKELLPYIENEVVRDIITFMAFTGLRVSEAFGLRYCDVNFERQNLTVNKQIFHTKDSESGYILINPKCNNVSSISLNNIAFSILVKQKESKKINSNDFIFVDYNNEPFRKDGFIKYHFEKAVNVLKTNGRLDVNKIITFHSLRHTYASMLVHLNENIFTVQNLLRHKDFKLTYNTYAHMYPDNSPKSFESINNEFGYLIE